MSPSIAQWLIGLGVGVFLALIGGIVKIGIAFGAIGARLEQLEADVDDSQRHRDAIVAHMSRTEGHLEAIDRRCEAERAAFRDITGPHRLRSDP